MNAALTVGRDYCRGCKKVSRQSFAGYATGDGHENSARPRAFYRQCDTCLTPRLVLQNVLDAEGLCRTVLKAWLDKHGGKSAVGAMNRPFGDGSLDPDDGLGFLTGEVWHLYLEWQPELSDNSFLAYASALLPRRLASWSRDASGEVETRAKGRRYPKAHAASVSVSLDALTESDRYGEPVRTHEDGRGRANASLSPFAATDQASGSDDLLRVLTAGGGGRARGVDGAGVADDQRPASPGRE